MKIHNIISKPVLFGTLLCCTLLTACDFSEINAPKYQAFPDDLKGDNFNLGAFFPQMQDIVFPAQENDYQMCENLLGAVYSRYMMTTNQDWNAASFSIFTAPQGWTDAPFSTTMTKTYTAWNEIKTLTEGEGVNFAWAQILRVAAMQRVTDMYGPIPYTKVETGNLLVPYDSQEEVYKAMFNDLTAAIDVMTTFATANPSARPMADYDGVYGGDFGLWVKFANSLKLRMALRIRYADAALAQQMAEEAVNHVYGVMTTNSDNAKYYYSKGNPLNVMWDAYTDSRVGADLTSVMTGYADPRMSKYFQESKEISGKKGFIGLRGGANVQKAWALDYSAPKAEKADPLYWMSVSEITFCRAEGALLGWSMKGEAQALYEQAIQQSFEQWGASGVADYIKDATKVPADYEDPRGMYSTSAVNTTTIKWDDALSAEQKLEKIIMQKWIALFPIGQEAWSEHRRTGYPKFFALPRQTSAGNLIVANRIPFSYKEYDNNGANVAAAVALLGGEDNYSTKLWWDKKTK